MRVLLSYLLICFLPTLAQAQPKKPITDAQMKEWIDSCGIGGQISLSFKFTELEIKGKIANAKEQEAERKKGRQEAEAVLQKNSDDLTASLDMCAYAKDTTELNALRAKCHTLLDGLLARNPLDAELYFKKGKLFQSEFRFAESFDQYAKAQKLMPDSAKVYQKMGELYFFTQQHANAYEYFQYALKIDDKVIETHLYHTMTDLFLSMMQLSQLEQKGEKMEDIVPRISQNLAPLEQAIQKYADKQAFKDFKIYARVLWIFYKGFMVGASKMEKTNISMEDIKLADMFYLIAEDKRELDGLEKELTELSKRKSVSNPALAYEALGFVALMRAEDKKGFTLLEKARKLNPDKGQLYHSIAFIHVLNRNYKKAEELLRNKLLLSQEEADYVVCASTLHYQKIPAKMRELCMEGLQKFPNSQDLTSLLGMAYCMEKKYDLAEVQFQKILEAKAKDEDKITYRLALAQLGQSKWEEAKKNLIKARELKHEHAGKILKDFFE